MGNLRRDEIGKVVYAVADAYRVAGSNAEPGVSWDDLPQETKDLFLGWVDFYIENPAAGPKELHEDWLAKQLDAGWSYGETFNAEAKTDPMMVAYEDDLDPVLKTQDALIHAVVRSMAGIVLEAKTVVTVQKASKAGLVGVKYIGARDLQIDNLYGTKLLWVPGQVHNVDQATATKMAQHSDVYELVPSEQQDVAPEQPKDAANEKPELDQNDQMLPNLETMNKDQLIVFAQQRFNLTLPKNMKEDNMRQRIFGLMQSGK